MADANYGSVGLLIPGIGANNSTDIYDYSKYARTISVGSGVKITTSSYKFYGSALTFPRSAGAYLTLDGAADLRLETSSAWTIRFWIKPGASGAVKGICANRDNSNGFVARINADRKMQIFNTGAVSHTTTGTLTNGVWQHVEFVLSSGTLYVFVNGTLDSSAAWSNGTSESSDEFVIGAEKIDGTSLLEGELNDFEITLGVARHTSAFTAPTQLCPETTGVAKIGSTAANSVEAYSVTRPDFPLLLSTTPDSNGDYSIYTADTPQVLVCHHDDPSGTVVATPEAAVIDPGGTQNFYGINEGANNVGGINSILLSTL